MKPIKYVQLTHNTSVSSWVIEELVFAIELHEWSQRLLPIFLHKDKALLVLESSVAPVPTCPPVLPVPAALPWELAKGN